MTDCTRYHEEDTAVGGLGASAGASAARTGLTG